MRVKKLPMILALHLKRFKYMEQLQRYTKLSYRVVFPLELRLFNTSGDATNPERLYDLVAVVVHCGRCAFANTQPEYNTYITISAVTEMGRLIIVLIIKCIRNLVTQEYRYIRIEIKSVSLHRLWPRGSGSFLSVFIQDVSLLSKLICWHNQFIAESIFKRSNISGVEQVTWDSYRWKMIRFFFLPLILAQLSAPSCQFFFFPRTERCILKLMSKCCWNYV